MFARTLVAITLIAAAPAAAGVPGCAVSPIDAQPRCKKGCPCGNACISCSKTCRIGTPAAEPKPAASRPAAPSNAAALVAAPSKKDTAAYTGAWYGSSANRFYFRANCPVAALLAIGDQVVMPDSAAAESIGFRRLVMPGC
jgi:hypothetical protein